MLQIHRKWSLFPEDVTPLKCLPKELSKSLKPQYLKRSAPDRALACLINGIFTNGLEYFMISIDSVNQLIKEDPNEKKKVLLSGTSYNNFMRSIQDHPLIQLQFRTANPLAPSSKRLAGVYRVVSKELLNMMSVDESPILKETLEAVKAEYNFHCPEMYAPNEVDLTWYRGTICKELPKSPVVKHWLPKRNQR